MAKKEFSSFDVAAAVQELKSEIPDSRVNNIYQQDAKTFILKLHKTDRPPIRLVLEAGRRLHLTAYAMDNPHNPPAFCMALRKHLRNTWLLNIEQYEFERIVALTFKTHEGNLKLILELFGEGNLILVNEKGTILQALQYKRMRDRNILPNQQFQLPPSMSKNPFRITQTEFTEIVQNAGEVEIVRTLARALGMGGTYAEELLLRANLDKTKLCNTLSQTEIEALFGVLKALLDLFVKGKLDPCAFMNEDGEYVDVAPIRLKRNETLTVKTYQTFNTALDEFYSRTTTAAKAKAEIQTGDLKHEQEKLRRMVTEQQLLVSEAEGKAEAEKLIGDSIYANSNELQKLLDLFSAAKSEGRDYNALTAEITAAKQSGAQVAFFESYDSRNLALNVAVDEKRFSLDLRKSLFDNANEYYERCKRIKQKAVGAKTALIESQKHLTEVEAKLNEAEHLQATKPAEALEELGKRRVESKEWYTKFRYFQSTEGFLVVAGKDQVSNEVLVKKHTDPDDIVFHAEITGSPFVVVKTEHREPGEQTIKEAAEFAAAHSRAWRESIGSADVYWVKPEQLSRTAPSGEFVPHGAFFVSGKRNWVRNVPLRIAIGVFYDGEPRFVGGPVDAVKATAKALVILAPGDLAGKDLLKTILRSLSLNMPKEQRAEVTRASVEAIREFVPYTKGRILPAK